MSKKPKILIVDDEPRITDSLRSLLSQQEFEIHTARDGLQAELLIDEHKFDGALLDLLLPDTTGQAIMEEMLEKNPDMFAIIMTGNASVDTAVEVLKKGAYDYLKKPFESQQLIKTIQNALDQKRLKTENTAINRKLETSKRAYQYLVENSPDVIYMLDHNGCFTFVNPSIQNLTGHDPSETIGSHYSMLIAPQAPRDCQWIFNERRTGARAKVWNEIQLMKTDPNGNVSPEVLFTEVQSTGMYNQSGQDSRTYTGTHGIIRDITPKKIADRKKKKVKAQLQKAEKMEIVGTLASGVAHDLNNLLTSLLAYPELVLMDMPSNDPLRDYILQIKDSGEKAAVIVKDLLTLARRRTATNEILSMDSLVKDLTASAEFIDLESRYPDIDFTFSLNSENKTIQGSFVHLSKSIMNLLSNAAESIFTKGSVSVSTQTRLLKNETETASYVKETEHIKLVVSDTGIGMSDKDIEKIFDPFYTRKKMGRSGTGLGMTIVWTTIKDHNGYIEIQSMPNLGTSISLYFPVIEKPQEPKRLTDLIQMEKSGHTVLVVDDLPEQLALVEKMLTAIGYQAIGVDSGEKAINYLKTGHADMVLLDMVLGSGMDGLDTYKKIQKIKPGQKTIIISGLSKTDRIEEALKLGVCRYIRKPFGIKTLGVAIKKEIGFRKSLALNR